MAEAAEGLDARSKIEGAAAIIAPVDDDRVRVERAGVGEAAAQCGRVVLVDGRRAETQLYIGRRDIVDRHFRAAAGAGAVGIGHPDADGITAAGRLIKVLMANSAESQHASGQVERGIGAAVAPGDDDHMGVQGARIRKGAT